VLEERDGGRRVIGEALEGEKCACLDRAADERVNFTERQRERGAGRVHAVVMPPLEIKVLFLH
jgi:hypothetical protein